MPQSISIAAFVFGAVLLLIAVLGGKFKIFGAEVSGTAGRTGRSVAAVVGSVLIVIGLVAALQRAGEPPKPAPDPQGSDQPGTPTILSFQVAPSRIKDGDSAQLQWAVQDASNVVIDPEIGEVPLNGSRTVSPKATTAYALRAGKGGSMVQARTELTVAQVSWEDRNSVGALAGDRVDSFTVSSYEPDSMVAELSYSYNPQHGQVWIGSYLLDENEQSISGGFSPTAASTTGKTALKVSADAARGRVRSKWVFFWMYESNKGEGFVSKRFPYDHVWN